jgi:uncharacterized protein (DUF1778 family)
MKIIDFFTCRNVVKLYGTDGKKFATLRLDNEEFKIVSMAAELGNQTVEEFIIELLVSLTDDQKKSLKDLAF